MYNSVLLAEYLISLANSQGVLLNMTKVQKLLYIMYGSLLSKKGRLISDESPKAWPFGPVFPKVHKRVDLKKVKPLNHCDFDIIKDDEEITDVIYSVIEKFSKFSATQLSDWSHIEDSPWDLTTKEKGFKWNSPISTDLIVDYFSKFDI